MSHEYSNLSFEEMIEQIDSHFANGTFEQYEELAKATAQYPNIGHNIVYPALGLGEAGEIQNQVKKIQRDDGGVLTDERREKIVGEMGDLLWYMAMMAQELGIPLQRIARRNLIKLMGRLVDGTIKGDRRDGS